MHKVFEPKRRRFVFLESNCKNIILDIKNAKHVFFICNRGAQVPLCGGCDLIVLVLTTTFAASRGTATPSAKARGSPSAMAFLTGLILLRRSYLCGFSLLRLFLARLNVIAGQGQVRRL